MAATSSAFAQSSCASFNITAARFGATPLALGPFSLSLGAGDVITLIDGAGGFPTNTLTVGSSTVSFSNVGSTSITVSAAGVYSVSAALGPPAPPGTARLFCTPGPNVSANAQTAIANGLRILQNYQEWVTKGVMGSFGLTRGGGTATTPRMDEEPSAQAKLEKLVRAERSLVEELASLPANDERSADLTGRLGAVRHDLKYARTTATLALAESSPRRPMSGPVLTDDARPGEVAVAREAFKARQPVEPQDATARETQVHDGPVGSAPVRAVATPQLSLDARDLDFCLTDCADGVRDVLGRKWNVWMEGRVVSANDSLAQSNALGFAGGTGVDYKFLPWLAVGMSLGVETFETRFGAPGARIGTLGLSAVPYFGMRLHDNIYASGFIGLTKLNYTTNPSATVAASFDALRFFFGGALSGVWHDGPWRFQPSILAAYGTESQNAYTDTSGTNVVGQTVNYGRLTVGPEIGYTFKDDNHGWSFEPFVLAKANVDFSSSNITTFSGSTPSVVRSGTQGSGQLGLGAALQLFNGFYLRVQASYDSIGVSGLDVWSGLVRGGFTF